MPCHTSVSGVRILIAASCLISGAAIALAADVPADKGATPSKYLLLLDENFSKGADRWAPASPEGWKLIDVEGGKAFSQFKNVDISKKVPHRSPWNIALLKDMTVGDFVLEVKLRETNEQAGAHRDCCLVFGYQNPSHFYYIHFSPAKNDPHADQVFIVNEADRLSITDKDAQSPGVKWGSRDEWRRLKIVRNLEDGLIAAYVDDMEKPIMVAHDKKFTWGRVGIGTFDDTADFAEVKLWGNKVKPSINDVDYPAIPVERKP